MNKTNLTSNELRSARKFTINSAFGKVGQRYVIQPCRNPKTGRFPEHIRPVNSNGDMILSQDDLQRQSRGEIIFIPQNKMIEFECPKEFDMDNPMDRADWEAIQYCPLIASERFARDAEGNLIIDGNERRYGAAELYIENPMLETKREVDAKRERFDAESLIFNDPRGDEGRRMMAKIIGRDMTGSTEADVLDYLLKIAQKTPKRIITLYTGDDLSLRMLFVEAREKKIIRLKNKLYVYGDEGQYILGATDDAVINFMRLPSSQKIVQLIKEEVDPVMYGRKVNESGEVLAKEGERVLLRDDSPTQTGVMTGTVMTARPPVPDDSFENDGFDGMKANSVEDILSSSKRRTGKKS